MLLCEDGKFAGWNLGRAGSFRLLVFARRELLPAVLGCAGLGDGDCRLSNRGEADNGEDGLIAGEVRGEGIFAACNGERTGESPL